MKTHTTKFDLKNAGIFTWKQWENSPLDLPLSKGAKDYLSVHSTH